MLPSLRAAIPLEEFDYGLLMTALRGLKNPRQKVTALLRQGHLVRIPRPVDEKDSRTRCRVGAPGCERFCAGPGGT